LTPARPGFCPWLRNPEPARFLPDCLFSWHLAPSFVSGITIAETSGDTTFLEADRLTFKLSILPLLHKEVRLKEIVVERPELMLSRNRAELQYRRPAQEISEFSIHLRSVRIISGWSALRTACRPEGFTTSLEKLDLDASGLDRGKSSAFKLPPWSPTKRRDSDIRLRHGTNPGQKESLATQGST
jgi:hypothetical protein